MKIAANIAGALLGFIFVVLPILILLGVIHQPPPPADSPAALFFGAFGPTGWITFVQICEIVGGLLVAIPTTRNFGLLVLGPIVINILCFHLLVAKAGLVGPPLVVAVLAAFLLFAERNKFASLAKATF
jgi:putative oxidoreductase